MNLIEFLQNLSLKGVKLWSEGEHLRVGGSKELLTPAVVESLKQYKAEILQLLRDCPETFNVYPLSYGQQSLWFLWQLAPKSAAYHVAFVGCIRSEVDESVLRKAFAALIERHPMLHSRFPRLGSEPIQQIMRTDSLVDFQTINASDWSDSELNKRAIEAYQLPFDLEAGLTHRVRLFTRSAQEHILLLTVHHIACDGWSLTILIDELPKLYQAKKAGVEASLRPIEQSYQDYLIWQQQLLASAEGEKLWNYWKEQLAGELPVLNLPTDRSRSTIQTYNGATNSFSVSRDITTKLKELAQAERTTLYTILLAAFQILLYRLSGQEDILVGSPTTGRSRSEFAPIVGHFVNPIVLRSGCTGNPIFKEFLAQVRHTVLGAIAHQEYPFSLLVERLQPQRDSSRSPIFQVFFILQKFQQTQEILELLAPTANKTIIDWGGLQVEPFLIPQQEGQFDLTLEMFEASESLIGAFKYNTDLFDATTIERMTSHFQTLLETIVNNPEQPIANLPLLTSHEQQLLADWNDTIKEYPQEFIHQLFAEQALKTPEAIAVVFAEQQLTYRELNHRANQLAHYLQQLGVEPEKLVGICVERSLEMVVGLLGILKAGGAYIPLDPTYPQERLAYMLEDAAVSVLLTQKQLINSLPQTHAQVIYLDADWQEIAAQSSENPVHNLTPETLAYVIYTSGSTGKPKGAMNTHQGISNRLLWMQEAMPVKPDDKILQKTPFSFDVSIWELFLPLITGATLVVAKLGVHRDPNCLANLIDRDQITIVHFVPSMLHAFLEEANLESRCRSLKQVICSGEALSLELQRKLLSRLKCELYNLYGPTEAAIDVTYWKCQPDNQLNSVPIGRPIANTQMYILDSYLQPVPIGVVGELHIGGIGLARGYLNRPELTAAKFIANPFESSNKLYKTGDLARYLPDGNIEFLGRIDDQVKIRGFRIELGEIQSVLQTHPQIKQAIVVAREGKEPGNKQLIGYLVPLSESLSRNEVRDFLKQKLPEYAIPQILVFLEALPLLPNGKIDRKHLPNPDADLIREGEFIAPRTDIEKQLLQMWLNVLQIEKIGIYDNFFELGGNSLLAIKLMFQIQEAFQIELPMRQLLQAPTIAELAKAVETLQVTNQKVTPLPIAIKPSRSNIDRSDLSEHPLTKLSLNLPKLPLPSLEETCDRYLEIVAPLLSETELIQTKQAVMEFKYHSGKPLQRLLEMLDRSTNTSYIHEIREEEFLESRLPLPVFPNTGAVGEQLWQFAEISLARRVAVLILSALEFYAKIKDGSLEPDRIGGRQLCMTQYPKLFGTSRIPGIKRDGLRYLSVAEDEEQVVIVYRNVFYSVKANVNGELPSLEQLEPQIDWILTHTPSNEPPIGILTTLTRTKWTIVRSTLATASPENDRSLQLLDNALFVVCIDEKSYNNLEDIAINAVRSDGCNRWFDKTLQFILTPDLRCSVSFDHAPVDGYPLARTLRELLNSKVMQMSAQIQVDKLSEFELPEQLQWQLTPEISEEIESAKTDFEHLVKQLEIKVLDYQEFGEELIATHNFGSTEAAIQLAIQLAYFRMCDRADNTYQPAHTRYFRYGRTEGIRSVTPESTQLIQAFNQETTLAERYSLLKKAIKAHLQREFDCSEGHGCDRHLTALYTLARNNGKVPDIFRDKAYSEIFSQTVLLTSGYHYLPGLELFTFGPEVDRGYGITYLIRKNRIVFSITSLEQKAGKLIDYLKQSLSEFKELLS
jgi:amino acid adenylation domain-containing protein